jgi:hypothetical protein
MAIEITLVFTAVLGLQAPSNTRSQLAVSRRCAVGSALPLLALRPLASLAATPYLAPGQETEEFKSLDARASEFKRKQLAYKKQWEEITARFISAPSDDKAFESLGELQRIFRESGEKLPEGLSRDAFLKTVRRKQRDMEAAGKWEKPVRMRVLELKTAIDNSLKPKGMSDNGTPVFG